jgi:hypothetical protein
MHNTFYTMVVYAECAACVEQNSVVIIETFKCTRLTIGEQHWWNKYQAIPTTQIYKQISSINISDNCKKQWHLALTHYGLCVAYKSLSVVQICYRPLYFKGHLACQSLYVIVAVPLQVLQLLLSNTVHFACILWHTCCCMKLFSSLYSLHVLQ